MASSLRVKIQCTNHTKEDSSSLKFVYLIDSPATTTISKLMSNLQDFIISQFGYQNIHLVNLTTDDGYLLMQHYMCNHILINNEKLICIDMNQFVSETIDTLNIDDAWFRIEHHDTTDSTEKSLTVGLNNTGKLYVYLFGSEKNRQIYLFNTTELLSIVHEIKQDSSHPMMKIGQVSPWNWCVEAKWEHDLTSNNTLLLTGSLKTGDMAQAQTGKLQLKLNELTKMIDSWQVIDLSLAADDNNNHLKEEEQTRLNQLKERIPSSQRTGPSIDTTTPPITIDTHECEGNSDIHLTQGSEGSVEVSQEMYANNGSFRNFIIITHIIITKKPVEVSEMSTRRRSMSIPVDKAISIVQVNVQYQQHDGNWIDCQNAEIVLTYTQVATSVLNIEPDKVISVAVEAAIPVKGTPNRNNITRHRAHRSLPQPLKLKIILTDDLSKTCSLIVEQINEPLSLVTREKFLDKEKEEVKKLIGFVDADDCEYDERIYTAIYINNDDYLVIDNEGRRFYISKSQIRAMQWNAKKNKTTEELIDFINDSSRKVTSLFDVETYLLYAIRIQLTTTTSQTIETVLLPLDEIK